MPSFVDTRPLDAIIIGAGFGGCYLLKNLRDQGFRTTVIEEGDGVGGVWRSNHYPGARVDTNTPFYEYSDPELWKEWEWTQEYPSQPEILKYFEFVDRKWDLSKDIQFGTKVTEASFDSQEMIWTVKTDKDSFVSARFLLPAMGFASKLFIPKLKGLETFQGLACHSAQWPEKPVDLRGKKVGIMGTGATGVQLIQEMGAIADKLVIFQRSPNCAIPMRQRSWTGRQPSKEGYSELFKRMKTTAGGFTYPVTTKKASDDTPVQRKAFFEHLWAQGGWAITTSNYSDFHTNIDSNRLFYNFWRDKVRERITKDDPELIENLAPWEPPYPFSTKRPSLEQNFYEILSQDNVHLEALKKNPIDEIVPTGVRMADGTVHELDALLLATGFDAVTGCFKRVDIKGLKGKLLASEWSTGSSTFLGLATSGFPNLLYLYGPQSPTAMAIGPVISEIQGDWIIDTLKHMRARGYSSVVPSLEAEQDWARKTNEACNKTLLPLNETTWYMGANVPGKKREALNYMGGLAAYREALDECVTNGWAGFHFQ